MKKRYGNQREKYMRKIHKEKDDLGLTVIYVEKCDRFTKEIQTDIIYNKIIT